MARFIENNGKTVTLNLSKVTAILTLLIALVGLAGSGWAFASFMIRPLVKEEVSISQEKQDEKIEKKLDKVESKIDGIYRLLLKWHKDD